MNATHIHHLVTRLVEAAKGRRKPPPAPTDPLDREMFNWGPDDTFSLRHHLNGGTIIIGRAGSGKTSSSGKLLARSIVGLPGSGGLILAAKPDDLPMWKDIFDKAGRANDLLVFSPREKLRFNLLSYMLKMTVGSTRDVTKLITIIGETLRAADVKGGGEASDFFESEETRMIYNVVEMLKLAFGTVTAPDMQRFIVAAPKSPAQMAAEGWADSFCKKVCDRACANVNAKKDPIATHDYNLAVSYWLGEYPTMADKTRSCIQTGVLGKLHAMNVGIVRELVSSGTNVTPDDILAGKWVIVDMPPAEYGDSGAVVAAGWKYLTERRIIRRREGGDHNPVTIWCDEAQQFVNSNDALFITQCRSYGGCLVFLAQSLHSFYAALKGDAGKKQADALLTNFSTRIFHAVGDEMTAKWASGMLGMELQGMVSVTASPGKNAFDEMFEPGGTSASVSFQYQPAIQTKLLMHGLRTGGICNNLICDAVVIRSADKFKDGRSWKLCSFSQKG